MSLSSSTVKIAIPESILKHSRANPTSPYAPLDQLYIQILSQHPNVRLLRDVFVLAIALGRVDIRFVCRRLRMSNEDLEPDLHRMHSILHISDIAIEPYHLSLRDFFQDRKRAGKHYIHPMRVALVRLPQNFDRFVIRNERRLKLVGAAIVVVLRILLATEIMGPKAAVAGWILLTVVAVSVISIPLPCKCRTWMRTESVRGISKRNTDPAV